MTNRPEFVVSDLHMGDRGPRDNFHAMSGGRREAEFNAFLDYVEQQNGTLRILGDLFELWQGNVSRVLTARMPLLDRLARMGAIYHLGNHDIDLKYFIDGPVQLTHPFFRTMLDGPQIVTFGKRRVLFTHGHLEDEYCRDEFPGVGRATAIYTGLREDKNGGPILDKYRSTTIENVVLARLHWFPALRRWWYDLPTHEWTMRRAIVSAWKASHANAVVYGHTHIPGQLTNTVGPLPIYNTGCWSERVNTFVKICHLGTISVWEWSHGKAIPWLERIEVAP